MSAWLWLVVALGAGVALWLALVAALVVVGRREEARALAGFVPDCLVLVGRLARDPRVPRRRKLLLVALGAYLASPLDLVPDFIPVAGQLDDALAVGLVLRAVLRGGGEELARAHWPGPEASLRLVLRAAGLDAATVPGAMKAAVVLMAYGSPERLEDVPAYYADIRGGRPIAPEHLDDLVERYRRLGIEDSSPLNAITERTRAALEAELGLPVFTGMKHWTPRIADAAEAAVAAGADDVVGLVLAPHYSGMSIAGYRDQLEGALAGRARLRFVESWHVEPGFVELLADRIRGTDAHVVFTAHSLPARIVEQGDPYRDQLLETAREVASVAGITGWSFSFQSESPTGEPWLGPDILDHLETLKAEGVERVLLCPVGFVSDHLEIRWDLDVEAREKAAQLGVALERVEMPNADPAFVRTLAGIVRRALSVPSPA